MSKKHIMSLLFICLLLHAGANAEDEWTPLDPSEGNFTYAAIKNESSIVYEFQDCMFIPPNYRLDLAEDAKRQALSELKSRKAWQRLAARTRTYEMAMQALEVIEIVLALSVAASQVIPVYGQAVAAISGALGLIISSGPTPLEQMQRHIRQEIEEKIEQLKKSIDVSIGDLGSAIILGDLKSLDDAFYMCGTLKVSRNGELDCLKDLINFEFKDKIFLPAHRQGALEPNIFPKSLKAAAQYISATRRIVSLYAQEEDRICHRSITDLACEEIYLERKAYTQSIKDRLAAIRKLINEHAITIIDEAFPSAFLAGEPDIVAGQWTLSHKLDAIEEYASLGMSQDRERLESLYLRQVHQRYSNGSFPQAEQTYETNLGYFTQSMDMAKFKVQLSKSINCQIRATSTYMNYLLCFILSSLDCAESFVHQESSTIGTLKGTIPYIMQAMVEEYYFYGAPWAKTNILIPTQLVVGQLEELSKSLDQPVIRQIDGYERIDFQMQHGAQDGVHYSVNASAQNSNIPITLINQEDYVSVDFPSYKHQECQNLTGTNRKLTLGYRSAVGGSITVKSRTLSNSTESNDSFPYLSPDVQQVEYQLPPQPELRHSAWQVPVSFQPHENLNLDCVVGLTITGDMSLQYVDVGGHSTEPPIPLKAIRGTKGQAPMLVNNFSSNLPPPNVENLEGDVQFSKSRALVPEESSLSLSFGICVSLDKYDLKIQYRTPKDSRYAASVLVAVPVDATSCSDETIWVELKESLQSTLDEADSVVILKKEHFKLKDEDFLASSIKITGPIDVDHIQLLVSNAA